MSTATPALDDAIAASYGDATAFHGDLGLSAGSWKLRILGILSKCRKNAEEESGVVFAQHLHSRDLYLATCCAERFDNAWRRFEALYQRYLRELVRCLSRNTLPALDVGEGLLADLFLPDKSGHCRIASYNGRSSLATWLHVIVTHRVANERVRKWNVVERPGEIPEVADTTSLRELEADMRASRYAHAIEGSLRQAFRQLTTRESQMLTWRYQRGLLLEEIAELLSVHPSTVFRQLERVQERLRNDVITILAETFGLADAAIEECLADVLENRTGSVSVLRMIKDSPPRDGAKVSTQHLHIA